MMTEIQIQHGPWFEKHAKKYGAEFVEWVIAQECQMHCENLKNATYKRWKEIEEWKKNPPPTDDEDSAGQQFIDYQISQY